MFKERSKRLAEKLGFKYEGLLRKVKKKKPT
jgi:RimJ/RimL family protein N-acetyltransferase